MLAAPATAAAEEHVEEVERRVEREVAEVGRRRAVGDVPVRVVALPLLGIAEDRVRLTDLLELLLRHLVAVVAVGVVLHRELAIRRFQLFGRAVASDAEHLVVVALDCRHRAQFAVGHVARMHDAHDRGAKQPVVEPVPGHELGDDGVLVDIVGLLGGDRVVHGRVEALADGRHAFDTEALERRLEFAHDELEPAHEELLGSRLAGVLDRAAEVVEHRQHRARGVLALVPTNVERSPAPCVA